MILKYYRSATVGIITDTYKILCDPWLVDGEYYGSWSHTIPYELDKNLDEINSYNSIYISHIHPDHCSEKTLNYIDKKIPIYISSYLKRFLKVKLNNLGFQVFEIQNGETKRLSSDLNLTIYAADNCNPIECYKFIGCADLNVKNTSQHFDSIAVFDDNRKVIVNVNDCPYKLSINTIRRIKNKYENIDLLLTGYSGAGEYPQCFDNLNIKEKMLEAKKKKEFFLNQSINFINYLKPVSYFLFAGTYILSGKLYHLNIYRGVPEKLEANTFINKNISCDSKCLLLDEENEYDLYKKRLKKDFIEKVSVIQKEFLLNKNFDYEDDKEYKIKELIELGEKAYNHFCYKRKDLKIKGYHTISISLGKKYLNISNSFCISNDLPENNYLRISTDLRLLANLFKGPKYAHWNNASIGSHINFFRKPNIYERSTYISLSYLHI